MIVLYTIWRKAERGKNKMEYRKSYVFTEKQLEKLEKRIAGDKSDKTGNFFLRVLPKVKEIVNIWIPRKAELEKIVDIREREGNQKDKEESEKNNAPLNSEILPPAQ